MLVLTRIYYFNSIKVQFKPFYLHYSLIPEVFQFHKGSIQTRKFNAQQAQKSNFNSIKVQFKRRQAACGALAIAFQFHKGSIQTSPLADMLVTSMRYFNSIVMFKK